MDTGICKLCGKEKELVDKSHIVPKHFHEYITHELKKYFNDIPTNSTAYIYSQNGKEKLIQNGLYKSPVGFIREIWRLDIEVKWRGYKSYSEQADGSIKVTKEETCAA
ncbi:MAG: hypothetical protein DSM106950_14510 [Stigonema ocellatum SAG 48.90 = DSM 106950]|nr:hypothetical protein [Stigonema ocellatum SAG 48.90 = DSM 106950]